MKPQKSAFRTLIRQMQCERQDADRVHIFLCNWWRVGADRYAEIFDAADDHAGDDVGNSHAGVSS